MDGSGGVGANSSSDFVRKLYKMLESPQDETVVRWGNEGDSFVVLENEKFTKHILPKHFKHSNFASFVRQLNKYDFHKVRHNNEDGGTSPYGPGAWEFRHPDFKVNNKDALDNIKRKAPAPRKPNAPPEELVPTQQMDLVNTQLVATQQQLQTLQERYNELSMHHSMLLQELIGVQKTVVNHEHVIEYVMNFLNSMDAQRRRESRVGNPFAHMNNAAPNGNPTPAADPHSAEPTEDDTPASPLQHASKLLSDINAESLLNTRNLEQMNEQQMRHNAALTTPPHDLTQRNGTRSSSRGDHPHSATSSTSVSYADLDTMVYPIGATQGIDPSYRDHVENIPYPMPSKAPEPTVPEPPQGRKKSTSIDPGWIRQPQILLVEDDPMCRRPDPYGPAAGTVSSQQQQQQRLQPSGYSAASPPEASGQGQQPQGPQTSPPRQTSAQQQQQQHEQTMRSNQAQSKTQTLSSSQAAKTGDERPWDTGPSTVAAQRLEPFHLVTFFILLSAGLMFLAVLLFFTADIQFQGACLKVFKRLLKTVALRQLMGILAAMIFVRFAMEPMIKAIRSVFRAPTPWERSTEFYVLREMYRPLELLFTIAAVSTLAENFLPQLIALPKGMIQNFVRSTLSLTFVIAAAKVVFSIKGRMTRESSWQLELKGDLTRQRRVEAVDKLLSVLTLLVASVFGLQAIGLDVNSVLAIGGVGGLAVGLAGREILENLFTGLIILSSSPFEVGEEVVFTPPSGGKQGVEGIVLDVGWYRTTIRSFEREIFNIPNSVFSRNVVLNVTRKQREWRFFEFIGLRVEDISRVGPVVSDMRRIIRQDPRIIQKLHRRVFLDKITREQISVYISCYVEAANRDAFMAVKQDLLLAFVDTVARNGARLAVQRLQIDVNGARATGGLPAGRPATASSTASVPPPTGKDGGGSGNGSAGPLPSAAAAAQSLQDNSYPQGPNPTSSSSTSSTNGDKSSSTRKRENGNADRNADRDTASPSSAAVVLTEEIRNNSQQLGNLITASFEEL